MAGSSHIGQQGVGLALFLDGLGGFAEELRIVGVGKAGGVLAYFHVAGDLVHAGFDRGNAVRQLNTSICPSEQSVFQKGFDLGVEQGADTRRSILP